MSVLPELYILRGDIVAALADGSDPSPAAAWYQQAVDRGVRLDARMAQLRAATRLARLGQPDGEAGAATRTLQAVYDTFTEGFDLPDLVEAREVLAAMPPG